MKSKISAEFFQKLWKIKQHDKIFGTVTVGERGQVVIPAEARKDLNVKPGDQLVVLGNKLGKVIVFMKADNMGEFMNMVIENLAGTEMEEKARTHFKKIFNSIPKE